MYKMRGCGALHCFTLLMTLTTLNILYGERQMPKKHNEYHKIYQYSHFKRYYSKSKLSHALSVYDSPGNSHILYKIHVSESDTPALLRLYQPEIRYE